MRRPGRGRRDPSAAAGELAAAAARPDQRARTVQRAGLRRHGLVLVGLAGLLALLLTVGAAWPVLVLVGLAGAGLPVVLGVLHVRATAAYPFQKDLVHLQVQALLVLVDTVTLAGVLRADQLSGGQEVFTLVAVVALALLRAAWTGLAVLDGRQQAERVDARLPAPLPPLPPLPPRPRLFLRGGSEAVAATGALLPVGLLLALLTDRHVLVPIAAWVAVALLVGLVAAVAPAVLRHLGMVRGKRRVRLAHAAVLRTEPFVVLYFDGTAGEIFWITMWLDTLEHLGDRKSTRLNSSH